jgi:hypothetical protein
MNLITGPVVYALAALCLLLGIATGVQSVHLAREQAAHASTRAKNAQVLQGLAESTAAVARKAQQSAQAFAIAHSANEQAYQKGIDDGKAAHSALVAGLLDRSIRLQQHWEATAATATLAGEVAAAAGGPDEGAKLRAESAGRIIGNADQCDNDIRWFQAELIATRALAESCGVAETIGQTTP